jgi:hypothetical protein
MTSLAVNANMAIIDKAKSISSIASLICQDWQILGKVKTVRLGE